MSYRAAFRTRGAPAFFIAALPGRIGIAMTALGIVWLVHDATGSFGDAGVVTGGFAIAEAIGGPQVARLIDRHGQLRVLPYVLTAHALAVLSLVTAATLDASLGTLVAIGALVGGSIPQLGALTTARWAWLLDGHPALSSAFAAESLSNGIGYLVGPIVVGTVAAFVHPAMGSVLAGALIVGGGGALAALRATAPPTQQTASSTQGLIRPGLFALAGINLGIGIFFGAMHISVTGFAVEHGAAGLAGPLSSITSVASLIGGLCYGARRWPGQPTMQLAVVLTSLTIGCLPLLVATSPALLAVCLIAPGLAIAPALTLGTVVTEATAPRAVLTQALTWLNSASAAGSAAAAAVAGHVLDTRGPSASFAVGVVGTATAAVLAITCRSALRTKSATMTP